MKNTLYLFLFFPFLNFAQNYVDLLKIGYGQTFKNDFENSIEHTDINSLEVDATLPVVLNEKHAFITGVSFSKNRLQLFPSSSSTSLYSTTLKVGLATTYNQKWSSTIVLLPKIASDYESISGDDFYFGGIAIFKLKKKENLTYRFGLYATQEAFGFFTTPIFGWYYKSPNHKFEMDMSLPIAADINYKFGIISLGIDYFGIGRSFNIGETGTYVDVSSLEFANYIQFNTLEEKVLLRAKFGYVSSDFEVYNEQEKLDLGVSAFSFGDNRTQLNPNIGGGLFLKFEAIYRFHLTPKKEETNSKQ